MNLTSEVTDKMTIGQFMKEADFFERSQEYMDLIKESYEVELMERYCECQQFIMENADSIDDDIMAELMTESKDANKNLPKVIEQKKSGIWSKIKAAVKKIITAIVTLFSRLVSFWKNGKELEALRQEAKNIKIERDFLKEDLEEASKKIESILRGKNHAVSNLRGRLAEKDAEIKEVKSNNSNMLKIISGKEAEIDRLHSMFKGVNPGLYRELKEVEMMIAERVDVYLPMNISEIDEYTKEVSNVVESYKVIRGQRGGNGDLHRKHARVIKNTLTKLKASRNKMVKTTIDGAWLEDVYKSLQTSREKILRDMDEISATFASGIDTPNNIDSSKDAAVHGTRVSADENYREIQYNLTGLLNEWVSLANESLKTMKELMDNRTHNLNMEAQILAEIKGLAA